MKTRSVALAGAIFALAWIPSSADAQGRSGKGSLTVCHAPPGNPDARRTLQIAENAWPAHEAHGDTLGACDGYGADHKREKKTKKTKKWKRKDAGYEDGSADEEIEGDDTGDSAPGGDETDRRIRREERRARRNPERARGDDAAGSSGDPDEVRDADDSGSDRGDDAAETDRRIRREQRREHRTRERSDGSGVDVQDGEVGTSDESGEAIDAGDPESGDRESERADRRAARREQRRDHAAPTETPLDAADATDTEEGFMGDLKRFFGFGPDESGE